MQKILYYLKPFKKRLIFGIILIFIVCAIQCSVPIIKGKLVWEFIEEQSKKTYIHTEKEYKTHIVKYLGLTLGLYFIAAVGKIIYNNFFISSVHKSIQNMRQDIYTKINKLPIKYFEQNTIGNIMNKITNNIDIISNTLQQVFASMIYAFFNIAILFVFIFSVNWRFGIIIFSMVPASLMVISYINKKTRNIYIDKFDKTSEYNGFLQEKLTGHKEIVLYNQQENSIKEFEEINQSLSKLNFKSNFLSNLTVTIINSLVYIVLVFVILAGASLLNKQPSEIPSFLGKLGFRALELGIFHVCIQYVWRLSNPVNELSQVFVVIPSAKTAISNIFEFLYEYEEKENPNLITLDKVEGNVNFNNVSFGYYKNNLVIKNMSLSVKKNQKIAIVGATGSGKTTLINLLTRFYEINEGSIKIDGIDIKNLKKENLRKIVGVIIQDIWLFKGTILENIKYGNPDKTDEEIIEIAKKTQLHNFVMSKKQGYQTIINEEVNNLSQGEKQLITITRTLLHEPSILILDEATSTIDTQIELILQESIKELIKNKTSFIIAHRLSTIVNADLIIVLQQGEIVEQGSHTELLNQKGIYYNLYRSQFQK
ncbi:ABC transporter ATP-binding protein ['Camptotheca acuminata' phytoplasma]|uniref:ABC transporter ATP-binding protein n=1 Tax='Camptotheca acuminata' phytoplasma TaxID=3239192 RepID=UPI00351A6F25